MCGDKPKGGYQMYVGIDVGGTYTDGVIVHQGQIMSTAKVPTYTKVSQSITEALHQLLDGKEPKNISRMVLSTTIITNLIAQEKYGQVGLILMPGPGINPASLNFAGPYVLVDGAVDYRGRILSELNKAQLQKAAEELQQQGLTKIVVACKFATRNKRLEEEAVKYLEEVLPTCEYLASSEVSGMLNWVRRANGSVFTLAIRDAYKSFVAEVERTIEELGISCPIHVLQADGGTIPLNISLQYPLEALYSGPAASALGALAATEEDLTAVVLDIGGTTTDMSLILKGVPLLTEKGASIKDYPLPVRALAVSSIPLGGDNSLEIINGSVGLGPKKGRAMCLGGPSLTVTDLMVLEGYSDLAMPTEVRKAALDLAQSLNLDLKGLCDMVLGQFIERLEKQLSIMFKIWEEEPAYRIWQVLNKQELRPALLVCQGGPAAGLGRFWAQAKGWQVRIPPYAQVANAVGAALARHTLKLEFTADTEQQTYSTNIGGYSGKLSQPVHKLSDAQLIAQEVFHQIAGKWKLEIADEPEELYAESYNMVRGWSTTGKILQVGLQTAPGLWSRIRQ